MANWIVSDRLTGKVEHAYGADAPDHFDLFPLEQYNHTLEDQIEQPAPARRLTKLDFISRIGDSAFSKLLELSLTSVEVLKFVKLIDWATPDPDGTSIDLDDPRVQRVRELEPILLSLAVEGVSSGWADEVLA